MPTTPSIPDSDSFNWIIVSATRCVQVVADGAKLSGLLQRAVMALADQEPMLQRLQALLTAMGAGASVAAMGPVAQPNWTTWANDLIRNDLHQIHVPGIIALWTSLEVAVEDTATLILVNDPQAVVDAVPAGMKSLPKSSPPLDEDTARRAFSQLERTARQTRSVAEAYAHVLAVLGMNLSIPSDVCEVLSELNYVRNCLLHRGGTVDSRVAREAPNSGLAVGDVVHFTHDGYQRYFRAVGAFAQAMVEAAVASRHGRWKSA